MAPTATGAGYYVVGADGSVYPFGDAQDFGGVPRSGGSGSPSTIVGIGVRPQGDGYWLVAADGTVTGFGAAASIGGGAPATPAAATVVGIAVTASGAGYRLVRSDGTTVGAGDAG